MWSQPVTSRTGRIAPIGKENIMMKQRKGHTKAQGEADVKRFRMNKYAPEMYELLKDTLACETVDCECGGSGQCPMCLAADLLAHIEKGE